MAMAHICTFCGVVSQSLRWPYRQVSFPKARRNARNDTEVQLKCLLPCLIAVVEHQLSQLLTSERKVVMEPSHATSKASCTYVLRTDWHLMCLYFWSCVTVFVLYDEDTMVTFVTFPACVSLRNRDFTLLVACVEWKSLNLDGLVSWIGSISLY